MAQKSTAEGTPESNSESSSESSPSAADANGGDTTMPRADSPHPHELCLESSLPIGEAKGEGPTLQSADLAHSDGSSSKLLFHGTRESEESLVSGQPLFLKDRNENTFDAFKNYERRYPKSSGSRIIIFVETRHLSWIDCQRKMNVIQSSSVGASWNVKHTMTELQELI